MGSGTRTKIGMAPRRREKRRKYEGAYVFGLSGVERPLNRKTGGDREEREGEIPKSARVFGERRRERRAL